MPTGTNQKTKGSAKATPGQLARKATRLRQRVDDREDLRDLEAAITRNAGKPGLPWAKARRQLGIGR